MNLRSYRTFQALILAGLGIFLFSKVMDGQILLYINRRFVILVLLAGLALLFLAQLILQERTGLADTGHEEHEGHEAAPAAEGTNSGWILLLVALPLLVGLFTPARPLSAGALKTRAINTISGLSVRSDPAQAASIPPSQRSLLDWIRITGEPEQINHMQGQPADVTGFVYHDPRLGEGQFMVARFAVACCVADASALGMVVFWPESSDLVQNGWVRVQGQIERAELAGRSLPAIRAGTVESVPEPEQPYIFP